MMQRANRFVAGLFLLTLTASMHAQGTAAAPPVTAPAVAADPFPPVNPKFFDATSPTTADVDGFLKAIWGYDANRSWRVAAIQKTQAPGVSK
ncbi:MAG: hypothetical protein ACRYGF_10305, partial [Janthinobacterium lividum]